MAIDTALKRRAAAGTTFPLSVSVTPDSDKDATWRYTVAQTYPLVFSYVVLYPPNIATAQARTWRATADARTWRANAN